MLPTKGSATQHCEHLYKYSCWILPLHELDTLGVPLEREVEAAEPVP